MQNLLPPDLPPRRAHSYNVGRSVGTYPPLHLVYVHGFRGDHTSFQRFPTDLHDRLDERIPSLQTHVYPTYQSKKPLQHAVDRLMDWMETLEPGYIILIGHSLGGFLVAEASMQWDPKDRSKVIGFIAMDVPYLGIHPHVIVSGIAALFPNDSDAQTETNLNNTGKVNMVKKSDTTGEGASLSPSGSVYDVGSPAMSPGTAAALQAPDLTPGPTPLQLTMHFVRKHYQDPWTATKEWFIANWEHGSMLLDPDGMRKRYERMIEWKGGDWMNYYTETVPGGKPNKETDTKTTTPQPQSQHPSFPVAHPYTDDGRKGEEEPLPSYHADYFGSASSASQSDKHPYPSQESKQTQTENSVQIHFPEPESVEPEPFEPLMPNADSVLPVAHKTPSLPSVAISDAEGSSVASTTSAAQTMTSEASKSQASVSTYATADDDSSANPHHPEAALGPDRGNDPAISLFPLPHPPLDDAQQKKHDKAVASILKEQEKAAQKAAKEAKKAADAEEKAQTKAEEAAKKAKAKAEEQERKARAKADKEAEKQKRADEKRAIEEAKKGTDTSRRFIILPILWSDRSHWQRVPVAGVPSEVDAHCGIFFREKNWDYDAFVQTVGDWVVLVCEKRGKDVLGY